MFYINGSFVKEDNAKISVLDLGLVRGYGVFDYLRTYQKEPFHLRDHLLRLKYSAKAIGISLPNSLEEMEKIIHELLRQCDYPESSIKIILTGGASPDQLTPQEKPSLIVHVYPLKPFGEEMYRDGIKAISTSLFRCIPESKTIQYIPAIMALQTARSNGAHEALYLNANKEILEATTSNFFAFKDGVLVTPSSEEVLHGITREVVLNLAKDHFPIEIRPLPYHEINQFDEAFITSSNKEIMPVVQIDHHSIKDGKVGKNTKKMIDLFAAYTKKRNWPQLSIERYR